MMWYIITLHNLCNNFIFILKSMSFYLMWRESTRQSLLFFLSPADVANLAHLSPWTNLFRVLSGQSTAYGPEAAALHRVAADLWLVTGLWSQAEP